MQIPHTDGRATVSPSQLRTYGSPGFDLLGQETPRGCPRKYSAKYVTHDLGDDSGPASIFGSWVHAVLAAVEQDGATPDEALVATMPDTMGPEHYAEARQLIDDYLAREADTIGRHTLAVEVELSAQLYVDELQGPVWLRGRIDRLDIEDADDGPVIHVVDYKSNRAPASVDDLLRDAQMKAYAWLVVQSWRQLGLDGDPAVVVHLDLLRYRDTALEYTADELADWRGWVEAVCRRIVRDDDPQPRLNDGCPDCPIRRDCPAWQAAPDVGAALLGYVPLSPGAAVAELDAWTARAKRVHALLDKGLKRARTQVDAIVRYHGVVTAGETTRAVTVAWGTEWDLQSLHRTLGDDFYGVVSTSKAAIERRAHLWPDGRVAAALACSSRVPTGTAVTERKDPDA